MEYALVYSNIENKIRSYIIQIVINKIHKNEITKNSINVLHKILNNFCDSKFFQINILNDLLLYNNNHYQKHKNIKKFFISSLKTFIINKRIGIYLIKYYYFLNYIYVCYDNSIEFICKKIYEKTKQRTYTSNKVKPYKLLFYSNIKSINDEILQISNKYKFTMNDDNNYNIINNIIYNLFNDIQNAKIIKVNNLKIFYNEKNIFLILFKNINNLYKNIIL